MSSVSGRVKYFARNVSSMAFSCSSSSLLMLVWNVSSCLFDGDMVLPATGRLGPSTEEHRIGPNKRHLLKAGSRGHSHRRWACASRPAYSRLILLNSSRYCLHDGSSGLYTRSGSSSNCSRTSELTHSVVSCQSTCEALREQSGSMGVLPQVPGYAVHGPVRMVDVPLAILPSRHRSA